MNEKENAMKKLVLGAFLAIGLMGCQQYSAYKIVEASSEEELAAIGRRGCQIVHARWARLSNNLHGMYDKWGYELIVRCP